MKMKICVRKHEIEGKPAFFGASIRGKFIPADVKKALGRKCPGEDEYVIVRLVGGEMPKLEGVFEAEFEEAWIDDRNASRKVLRLKDADLDFVRALENAEPKK